MTRGKRRGAKTRRLHESGTRAAARCAPHGMPHPLTPQPTTKRNRKKKTHHSQASVQHSVADLVAQLVGVTFSHRFRGEQESSSLCSQDQMSKRMVTEERGREGTTNVLRIARHDEDNEDNKGG